MRLVGAGLRALAVGLLGAYLFAPQAFEPLLRPFAPEGAPAVYAYGNLAELAFAHLAVTGLATAASACVAVAFAVLVTRPAGAACLPLSRSLANVAQTVPPVAVLALVVPSVGFGQAPILIALFLYGLLPIFENTLAGLARTPPTVVEAGLAAGMTPGQLLRQVELPLALPQILVGLRVSAIVGLSTAAIGSTVAAKTLGEVVIAGLAAGNPAYVVQGAAAIGGLAFLLSDVFGALERWAVVRAGETPETEAPLGRHRPTPTQ